MVEWETDNDGGVVFYSTYLNPLAVFGEKNICIFFKMMNLSGDFGGEATHYIHYYRVSGGPQALPTVKPEKAGTPNLLYTEKNTFMEDFVCG